MATELTRAIDEIEERLTTWRLRAGSADLSPTAMLDELARLLADARRLTARLDQTAPAAEPAARAVAHEASRSTTEAEWAEVLREPYVVTDRFGTVTGANSAFCELIGLPRYFTVGRPLVMFAVQEDRSTIRAAVARVASAERESVRVAWRHASGTVTGGMLLAMSRYEQGHLDRVGWVFYGEAGTSGNTGLASLPLAGEQAQRRSAFLTMASGVLSRSLDYEVTLQRLAELSVPLLGDWCLVDVLDDTGTLRPHATAAIPGQREHLATVGERPSRRPPPGSVAAEVIESARGMILRAEVPGFPRPVGLGPDELRVVHDLGVTSAVVVPLRARGQVIGIVIFLMGASRRRHTESDLLLAEELANRAGILVDNARLHRAAQQASKAKSDFLAAMSHELRTPLTAVIGYSEILADEIVGPLTPLQKEQLTRIRASSEHLVVLVDEVLTFARLEAGHEELLLEEVDVQDLIDHAVTIVAVQARVRKLELRTAIPDTPLRFRSDRSKLRQILVNLLANAVKFTRAGEVGVRAQRDDGWVRFVVWDTGIGIAPEHIESIFAPFWQVDQQVTRTFGGSGLGLAVVRRLARLLGGDVTVASKPGEGTEFTVRLPLTGTAPEDARLSSTDPAGGDPTPSS